MACPICEKPAEVKYRPFCSKRCADADLGKWLNGSYAIGGSAEEDAVSDEQVSAQIIDLESARQSRDQ